MADDADFSGSHFEHLRTGFIAPSSAWGGELSGTARPAWPGRLLARPSLNRILQAPPDSPLRVIINDAGKGGGCLSIYTPERAGDPVWADREVIRLRERDREGAVVVACEPDASTSRDRLGEALLPLAEAAGRAGADMVWLPAALANSYGELHARWSRHRVADAALAAVLHVASPLLSPCIRWRYPAGEPNLALREGAFALASGADMIVIRPVSPFINLLGRIAEKTRAPVVAWPTAAEARGGAFDSIARDAREAGATLVAEPDLSIQPG